MLWVLFTRNQIQACGAESCWTLKYHSQSKPTFFSFRNQFCNQLQTNFVIMAIRTVHLLTCGSTYETTPRAFLDRLFTMFLGSLILHWQMNCFNCHGHGLRRNRELDTFADLLPAVWPQAIYRTSLSPFNQLLFLVVKVTCLNFF